MFQPRKQVRSEPGSSEDKMMSKNPFRAESADACLDIFPLEVWERILSNLKNEDLLACRLVCKDLKCLVDDQFKGNIWKPYFAKNRVADVLSLFLVKCRGTRFCCAEDVDEFFDRMKNVDWTGRNPFVNRTIILHCRAIEQYSQLCERFPELVEQYGGYVRHCLYFVHNEVVASIRNIPVIFRMKNLRSLTIYCADWDKRAIRGNLVKCKSDNCTDPVLKKFTVLNVLGDRGYMILSTLFSGYGHQIKRLNCWGHNLMEDASREFAKDVTETLPNLEEFKICDVSGSLLSSLSAATWPLKRLSVKVSMNDDTVSLGGMVDSLKNFTGTLESFHFQVDEKQVFNNLFLYKLRFPNVTELRVPYYFISKGTVSPLLDLVKKFRNVKHLQLVDTAERPGTLEQKRQEHEAAVKIVLDTMWRKLPLGVQVISVRFRVYSDELRSNVSVVTKYLRNRVQYY